MNEHFLHFVWKNGLFDLRGLRTASNENVKIIYPGLYNRDSGPDFLNARIKIANTEWAGNVEIHYRASSWFEHRHNRDKAYNNVILHVVIINDREAVSAAGEAIDTIEIKIAPGVAKRYEEYMSEESVIACRSDIHRLDKFTIRHGIFQMAVKRLERKTSRIGSLLEATKNDWEEVLYRLLASNIGLNVNRESFMQLSTNLPLRLIRKHSDSILQVEALMFGQAGLLNEGMFGPDEQDTYLYKLQKEYAALKSLYKLKPMDHWIWKFHRMRPVNFPTRRISQLACLMTRHDGLFRKIIETQGYVNIADLLHTEVSGYWLTHYRFGRETQKIPGAAGEKLKEILIVNSIVPLIWMYGKIYQKNEFCDRAIDLAESIPPENNRITRQWHAIGIDALSSFETQGLIEITEEYCKKRKCLYCHIGTKLISLGNELNPESELILGEPL